MKTQLSDFTVIESAAGLKTFQSKQPFNFELGGQISPWTLVFETYGKLSPVKDNAILIHHALSTNSHVASHEKNPNPGWWEAVVGPNKAIDTNRFFVICVNNLGSCFGSSGPASINPETNLPYRRDFPAITIADIVKSQQILITHLGIQQLNAVVGNSMGAMISLQWAILYPEKVQRLISVSSCYKSYPVSIATHAVQREIIALDPEWREGYYETSAITGFKIARKFGLLSYRNPNELNARFTRENSLVRYLDYNAEKFVSIFDLNCYLYIFDAMDHFDVTEGYEDKTQPFRRIRAKTLVVSVSSDLLFPPQQQQELYQKLLEGGVDVTLIAHDSDYGHDAFYADKTIIQHIQDFLR